MPITTDAPTRARTVKAIRDDVFEKIIDERAIQSEAAEMQITVSSEDIIERSTASPRRRV